jgi:hypothetical protein
MDKAGIGAGGGPFVKAGVHQWTFGAVGNDLWLAGAALVGSAGAFPIKFSKKSHDSLGINETIAYLCIPFEKMGIGLCLNESESNYSLTITIWWINPLKRSSKPFAVPVQW